MSYQPQDAKLRETIEVSGEKELITLNKNLDANAEAQKKVAAAAKQAAAEVKQQNTLYKKLGLAQKRWGLALKSHAEGFDLFSGMISKTMGLLGPWGAAVGGAIGMLTAFYNRLSKPPSTEEHEKRINALAAAYASLGQEATLAAAQEKLAAEATTKAMAQEIATRKTELDDLQVEQNKYFGKIREYDRLLETATGADIERYKNLRAAEKEKAASLQPQIDSLKDYIALQDRTAEKLKDEREMRELEASEQKLRDAYNAEQEKKRQKAIEEEKRKREKAAQETARQREKEQTALANLRARTEEMAFGASSANAIERLNREYEQKKKLAETEYKNEQRRQQALAELETQRVIAVENEKEKIREDLAKRASAIKMAGGGTGTTNVEKAQAAWQTSRAQMMSEIEELQKLQADYEKNFTSVELSTSVEYLAIKDREKQAAKELAEAELASYSAISDARRKDLDASKEAMFEKIYEQKSLTKAQKEAANAANTAFSSMAAGLEAWGVSSTAVQKMQMIASGIQAGADAIDYGARALAFFATGNPVAGAGMMAAATGKTMAAAAYAAGVADLGGSAPRTSSSLPSAGASSYSANNLTGATPKEPNEITVNFAFEGSDNQIASALIRGFNASAGSLGAQKIKKSVISNRV